MIRTLTLAFAAYALMRGTAHAGLDPAVQTLMLQATAGAVAGGILAFRGRITRVFSRLRRADQGVGPDDGPGDGT